MSCPHGHGVPQLARRNIRVAEQRDVITSRGSNTRKENQALVPSRKNAWGLIAYWGRLVRGELKPTVKHRGPCMKAWHKTFRNRGERSALVSAVYRAQEPEPV